MTQARVLVLGATGAFGARLSAGLARSGFRLLIAARTPAPLAALAQELRAAGAQVETLAADRSSLTASRLADLTEKHPDLFAVVDCAGPFQAADLSLPRAAIAAGLHYVDLADARDFVARVPELHDEAQRAGIAVLTGASSTPALSHAVLDELTAEARHVHAVDVAICPGNRAPRGRSVIVAILSYVGRPIRVFRGGRWREAPGWGRPERITLEDLGARRVSLCETPDLDLLVARYGPTADASFRAGLELAILHWGLYLLSFLVRWRLVRSLVPGAGALRQLAGLVRPLGSDRGGMRVEAVTSDRDGLLRRRLWTLVADAGDGPHIPTLPVIAAIKMLASGELAFRGAAACVGLIPYSRIAAEFRPFRIRTSLTALVQEPLFRRVLGQGIDQLPPALRDAHDVRHSLVLRGRAHVKGPANPIARLVAHAFRLPRAGADVPVEVEIRAGVDGSEVWQRNFRGRVLRSKLVPGRRRGEVTERFGPMVATLSLEIDGAAIVYRVVGARLLGIRVPQLLAPVSEARERVDADGRFTFDVPIHMPLAGRLVHYRGWLKPIEPEPAQGSEARRAAAPV
jgi:NAD(P)-dependent dehydrogenase (short-subunit alcohol dehydrogenase family)